MRAFPKSPPHNSLAASNGGERRSDIQQPLRILSPREVAAITTMSAATLARMERSGEFPARLKLGPSRVGWRSDDVDTWMRSRQQASQQNRSAKKR